MALTRMDELFDHALALPPDQREAFVKRACGSDAVLCDRLLRLVGRAGRDDGFLDRPILRVGPVESQVSEAAFRAGRHIGAFKLVVRLGAGGMGEVWRAERAQGEFTQTVALKIMLPGTAAALERFKIERRILASLEHSGIARLHDGGLTAEGWPWMAMEYVEGLELLRWCNVRRAGLRVRLDLFLQICDAVAYAHSHLVVHRDLKPANIFVTPNAEVKLLDFGLARLLTLDRASDGAQTTYFSPSYAAPEQLRAGAITTATDVFALGVTLYELLCDALPWPSPGAPLGTALKRMLDDTPEAPSRAAKGLVSPELLRGDLDAIIAKAMRHDSGKRYIDARAMAEDLRRHLRYEPVEARTGARGYAALRFLRRHWLPVSAAVTLIAVVLTGSAGVAWQAQRAVAAAARATVTRDFLIAMFKASDPRISQDKPRGQITAREMLDANVDKIDRDFAADPPAQIELLGIAADIYGELGEDRRYDDLHGRYLSMARRYYGDEHPTVLAALLSEAAREHAIPNDANALKLLENLDPIIHRAGLDRTSLRAEWWMIRGQALLADSSQYREQIDALQKAVALFAETSPADPMLVTSLADLGSAYSNRMEYVPARTYMQQAITVSSAVKNRNDAELATIYGNLALIAENLGDFEGADVESARAALILQKTYGESSVQSWVAAAHRARSAHLGGNRERAWALFDALLKTLPAEAANHDAMEAREWYANCLAAEGRASEALPLLEAAEQSYQHVHMYDYELPRVRATLGDAYARVGRMDDARRMLKAVYDQRIPNSPPDYQPVLAIRERWGRLLLAQGDEAGALVQFQEVVQGSHGLALAHVALAYGGIARVALARGDGSGALAASEKAVGLFADVIGFRDVRMGPYLWLVRSAALRATGDLAQAREWAQRALDASRRYDDPSATSIADAELAVHLANDGKRT